MAKPDVIHAKCDLWVYACWIICLELSRMQRYMTSAMVAVVMACFHRNLSKLHAPKSRRPVGKQHIAANIKARLQLIEISYDLFEAKVLPFVILVTVQSRLFSMDFANWSFLSWTEQNPNAKNGWEISEINLKWRRVLLRLAVTKGFPYLPFMLKARKVVRKRCDEWNGISKAF